MLLKYVNKGQFNRKDKGQNKRNHMFYNIIQIKVLSLQCNKKVNTKPAFQKVESTKDENYEDSKQI